MIFVIVRVPGVCLILKVTVRERWETDKTISQDSISKPKLNDLGITLNQSSRWQNIASIPEETFEEHIPKEGGNPLWYKPNTIDKPSRGNKVKS